MIRASSGTFSSTVLHHDDRPGSCSFSTHKPFPQQKFNGKPNLLSSIHRYHRALSVFLLQKPPPLLYSPLSNSDFCVGSLSSSLNSTLNCNCNKELGNFICKFPGFYFFLIFPPFIKLYNQPSQLFPICFKNGITF